MAALSVALHNPQKIADLMRLDEPVERAAPPVERRDDPARTARIAAQGTTIGGFFRDRGMDALIATGYADARRAFEAEHGSAGGDDE